ncbi:MAG: hypothetical protein ACTSYM_11520 [Candidatus Baldrarchaeia archaeon]
MEKEVFETIKKQLAERDTIIEKQRNRILLLQEKLNEVRETVSVLEVENEKLKNDLKSKEEELGKIKKAFDRLQEEMIELKSKLREKEKLIEDLKKERETKKVTEAEVQTEQIRIYENLLKELQDKFVNLQMLIVKAIAGDEKAIEKLRTIILKEGPLEAKILMLIYTEGISNVNELAEKLEVPREVLGSLLFMFEEEGLIKLEAEKIYVPTKEKIEEAASPPTSPTASTPSPSPATTAEEVEETKEVVAPDTSALFEEWKTLPTEEVYDRLLAFCRKYSTLPDKIGDALEVVCDILESRLKTFGGRIRFEMRREADDWRKGIGDFSELELKIADWKRRAKKVVEY